MIRIQPPTVCDVQQFRTTTQNIHCDTVSSFFIGILSTQYVKELWLIIPLKNSIESILGSLNLSNPIRKLV
jgi:hypothetical protein